MKKYSARALLVIPVLYAGIIALLVFLQFSDDQSFSEQFGALTLRGRRALALEDEARPITELRIRYSGLEFAFNSESTVTLDTGDGEARSLTVLGYEPLQDGFEVQLEDEVRVQFVLTGDDGTELHVRPQLTAPLAANSAISIPYAIVAGAERRETAAVDVVPVNYDSRTFLLAPPPRAIFDADALRLPADVQTQTVRYAVMPEIQEDVVERWFSDREYAVADQAYEAVVQEYIDRSYRAWRGSRFNPASGTWDMIEGSPRFDERILTATLAEAWRRDQYNQAFTDMRRAADRHPDDIGLKSSAFLGNLREVKFRVLDEDSARTQQLLAAVERRDADVFRTHDLASFALHRGSVQLADELREFVEQLDYRDLDPFQTVGLLYNAHVSDPVTSEVEQTFERFDGVLAESLFPHIIRTEEGFFLQSVPGQIDMRLSVFAGVVMEHVGRHSNDTQLLDVGRNLVVSALSLADEEGFLPRVLLAASGAFGTRDGALGPEELYPALHNNPAYPRLVSLYDRLGPGAWIWTVADITQLQVSPEEISFAVGAPVNRTHYMIAQGIQPFTSMELFGLEWRNDPSFEAYNRGRHYNPQTRTLLIKYSDTVPQRRVVLQY